MRAVLASAGVVGAAVAAAGCGADVDGDAAPASARAAPTIPFQQASIVMRDHRYSVQKLRARAGKPLVLTFENVGRSPHDFTIRDGPATHIFVLPGKRIHTSLTFTEPGRYRFFCSMPGHVRAGMQGVVVVDG